MTSRAPEPDDGDERSILLGWLAFHRDALEAKVAGLSDDQLVTASVPPSDLTVLGLVRHLAEMERVYGSTALAGGRADPTFVWGDYTDDGPDWDFVVDASMVAVSLQAWRAERQATDAALAGVRDLAAADGRNGRSARWNLVKLIGEYARHNGHADLVREAVDGATGE